MLASVASNAWCIGCGCNNAYNSCVEAFENNNEQTYQNNGDGSYTVLQNYGECKDSRRACHGTGISIQIF